MFHVFAIIRYVSCCHKVDAICLYTSYIPLLKTSLLALSANRRHNQGKVCLSVSVQPKILKASTDFYLWKYGTHICMSIKERTLIILK